MSENGIDREALARLHALGGQEFVAELLKLALQNIAEQLARGHEAAVQNDAEGVAIDVTALRSAEQEIAALRTELGKGSDQRARDQRERIEWAFFDSLFPFSFSTLFSGKT